MYCKRMLSAVNMVMCEWYNAITFKHGSGISFTYEEKYKAHIVFGILVVYSDDYFVKSIVEFNKILKLINRRYKLIVVFNKNIPEKTSRSQIDEIDLDFVRGSNHLHEFSAWDEGLNFVKNNYLNDYTQSEFIFCTILFVIIELIQFSIV